MDLHDFIPIPDLFNIKHLLCIQPHPDDNEIGAGGTIAVCTDKGIKVSYLTISSGKGGSNTLRSKDLVALRQAELKKAGERLGVTHFESLDLEDAHYPDEKELTEAIVEVIRRLKPDAVMTVDPTLLYEAHPTHRKTGTAVLEACLFASMKHFPIPDNPKPVETHSVQFVAFYASSHPNTFIDIQSTFERKLNAIACHQSQFDEAGFQQLKQYLTYRSRVDGAIKKLSCSESFKVLPMVLTHMMVDSETY